MSLMYRNKRRGILYFISVFFLLFTVVSIVFFTDIRSLKETIETTVKTDLKAYSTDIDNKIAFIASDVLLIEDIISNRNLLGYDNGNTVFTSEESRAILEKDVIDWITNRNIYDQVRILDHNGQEIFRVNYNNGITEIVTSDNLQNKSGRYYFENAIGLSDDVLYMSKIDLNIENGEIEYIDGSPKEMLRIGSTIYDENGTKLGMILVNYFAEHLFHDEETNVSVYTPFEVINEEGYYLHSSDKDIEYGFMYEDRLNRTFMNYHDYDLIIESQNDIVQRIFEGELYTSLIIDNIKLSDAITNSIGREIEVYSDNGDIYIFGEVEFLEVSHFQQSIKSYALTTLVVLLVAFLISRLSDEILYTRAEQVKVLEFTSTHDLLTGLPNRANIFRKINYIDSRKELYSLLFLDFDKFKEVNDKYGHFIGDKVLIEGSNRLKKCVRETDSTARIGGDEFLILLQGIIDENTITRITTNIRKEIDEEFVFDKITCSIGVSIGISIQDGTKSVQEMINDADDEMYKDKILRKELQSNN